MTIKPRNRHSIGGKSFSGNEQRLTWVHNNSTSLVNNALSAGIPSYVIQEEFCRFQGFWWQPVMTGIDTHSFVCQK